MSASVRLVHMVAAQTVRGGRQLVRGVRLYEVPGDDVPLARPEGEAVSAPLNKVLAAYGLPAPTLEYRFCEERRFRWDAAFVPWKVALEVDGSVWARGRHVRGAGYLSDRDKDTEGMLRGWIVVHTTPQLLTSAKTIDQLKRALTQKGWKP